MQKHKIQQQKIQLRKKIIKQRQTLSQVEWQTKSKQICHNLASNPLWQQATNILAYFSYRQEPDLSTLFKKASLQKQWGFPRCLNNSLTWHWWQTPQVLEPNKYSILEPLATSPLIKPEQVDLLLVPTVACDRFGYRLGYGGGYYDRLLSNPEWQNIPTIGITFEFAYLNKLPFEAWDMTLNNICTDKNIVKV